MMYILYVMLKALAVDACADLSSFNTASYAATIVIPARKWFFVPRALYKPRFKSYPYEPKYSHM